MKYRITLNKKVYEVEVEQGEATLLSEYEASTAPVVAPVVAEEAPVATVAETTAAAHVDASPDKVILAPLPGAVLDIMVEVGDTVNAGDVVAIIEAMKMENEVISIISGKVVQVLITKGTTVNTGAQLILLG